MKNTALIQARKKKGLTQRQVADKAQITITGYQRYELGLREPKVGKAQLIADTLNSTVEELFSIYRKDTTERKPRTPQQLRNCRHSRTQ